MEFEKDGRACLLNQQLNFYLSTTGTGTTFTMEKQCKNNAQKFKISKTSNEEYLQSIGNLKIALKSTFGRYMSG